MRNPEASYGTCHIGEGAREVEDAILDVYQTLKAMPRVVDVVSFLNATV